MLLGAVVTLTVLVAVVVVVTGACSAVVVELDPLPIALRRACSKPPSWFA